MLTHPSQQAYMNLDKAFIFSILIHKHLISRNIATKTSL